jgi:hypothetical protein
VTIETPYTAMLYVGCVAGVYAGAVVAAAEGIDSGRFALLLGGMPAAGRSSSRRAKRGLRAVRG